LPDSVYEIDVQVRNADGLHMRPAMQFVDVAGRFQSDIRVTNGQTTVDAKSIMQMTMLAATCGTVLRIRAEGADAADAIAALQQLVDQNLFGQSSSAADEARA